MTAAQATATAEKAQTAKQEFPQEERSRGQVATIPPPRIAYHPAVQQRFNIDQSGWRALIDAVWPGAKTAEAVILALSYCKARRLDPFKRPVHIVPVYNSALRREVEGVWPGIGELRTTAFRTGFYAGCDETRFGPDKTYNFKGKVRAGQDQWKDAEATVVAPEWAQLTVWRLVGGQRVPFPGPKIYFQASYGRKGKSELPNDKWQQMPSYMLEKVAEAAALRKAFPEEMGDMISAEEAEGQIMDLGGGQSGEITVPPQPSRVDVSRAAADAIDVTEDAERVIEQDLSRTSDRMPDTPEERGDATEEDAGAQSKPPAGDKPQMEVFKWIGETGEFEEFTDPMAWIDHAMAQLDARFAAKKKVKPAWDHNAKEWDKVKKALPIGKAGQDAQDRVFLKIDELYEAQKGMK